MVSSAFRVEQVLYAMITVVHVIASVYQIYIMRLGHLPSRLSKGPLWLAIGASFLEAARSVDPSGAFGRYGGAELNLFGTLTAWCVLACIGWVVYETLATIFYQATGRARSYRSKGLHKVYFLIMAYMVFAAVVAVVTSVVILFENKKGILGVWLLVLTSGGALMIAELTLGGRWLRRRLKKHFRSMMPNRKHKADVTAKRHVMRLMYFRYSTTALLAIAVIAVAITAITQLVNFDSTIKAANPEDYRFTEFSSMWIQILAVSLMLWLGWAPRRTTLRASDTLQQITDAAAADGAQLRSAASSGSSGLDVATSPPARMDTSKHRKLMYEEQAKKFQPTSPASAEAEHDEEEEEAVHDQV